MIKKKIPCPICKKKTSWEGNEFRPFCSSRCKIIDLGNWSSGTYSIPDNEQSIPTKIDDTDNEEN